MATYTIDAATEATINAAILKAHDMVAANPSMYDNAVVTVSGDTDFDYKINAKDNVSLKINDGVTLTLTGAGVHTAYDLSNTTNAGLSGSGTFDVAGLATYAVRGRVTADATIGNTDAGTGGADPARLTITGWKYGVAFLSSADTASRNISIQNVNIESPHTAGVQYPIWINNVTSINGKWVENVNILNVTVDGADVNGNGGQHGAANEYTADQIALQGVHGGMIENVASLNGGEVGISVVRGSRDIVIMDSRVEGADGQGFNIGGAVYAIDVLDASGFVVDTEIVSGGITADVSYVFLGGGADGTSDRIWVRDVKGGRPQIGDTITRTDDNTVSTGITETHRTANIILDGVSGRDNGIDVSGNGALNSFADFYIQQADGVTLNGISEARVMSDPTDTKARLGVFVVSSDYTLGEITYNSPVNIHPATAPYIPLTQSEDSNLISIATATVNGTAGNDTLEGSNPGGDIVYGFDGDDRVIGRGGADTIYGGEGRDIVAGGADNDLVFGGNGNDLVYGELGSDSVFGGAGNDFLFGESNNEFNDPFGHDYLEGGAGNDKLDGEYGNDTLNGGSGNDRLIGDNGHDSLNGGSQSDSLYGGRGNDTLDGGDGADLLFGETGSDTLIGGGASDSLSGGDGLDYLSGGVGRDTLDGGANSDTLEGGDSVDTLVGGHGNDYLYGGTASDFLDGGEHADTLYGQAGFDLLIGGAGPDVLDGGDHHDTLEGGAGGDTFVFTGLWGMDVITDFGVGGADVMDMSAVVGVAGIADLSITVDGTDTTILFGNSSVRLIGVTDMLSADDFIFAV